MQHFHIIAANTNPLPQDPHGEQSTSETLEQFDEALRTKQQIPEDVLLVDFLKSRKIIKGLKKYCVIIFYNIMSCMVFLAI